VNTGFFLMLEESQSGFPFSVFCAYKGKSFSLCLECFPVFRDYCKYYPIVSSCPSDGQFLVGNHGPGSSLNIYC